MPHLIAKHQPHPPLDRGLSSPPNSSRGKELRRVNAAILPTLKYCPLTPIAYKMLTKACSIHLVMFSTRIIAVLMGILCHSTFLGACTIMCLALFGAMNVGPLSLHGWSAYATNILLLLQFPLLHSLLLGKRGRSFLAKLFPGPLGQDLVTTTFVTVASIQLLALFGLWSPLGATSWSVSGAPLIAWSTVYAGAWVFLTITMIQAGLPIQMGYLGWWSVFRGRRPHYSEFPHHGLYRTCRHPVYLAMALVTITGPVWTLDHLLVCLFFLPYCVLGPLAKERRYLRIHGTSYAAYRATVPFFPTPRSCWRALLRQKAS